MKKKALIISGISWNDTYQRHQLNSTILTQLGYDVDFIESCKTSKLSVSKIIKYIRNNSNNSNNSNKVPNHLKIIKSTLIPPGGILTKFINKILFTFTMKKKIRPYYDLVLIYVPSDHYQFIKPNQYGILIYDCVRAFAIWGGYHESLINNEKIITKKANNILCDSFYIKDIYLPSISPELKPLQLLPPIEIGMNNNQVIVNKINKIGYFGTISHHIDIALLKSLIDLGYKINFWGIDELNLLPKEVSHFGYINNQEQLLSDISKNCDAIIIPYNKPLDGVYPAKLALSLLSKLPIYSSSFYDANLMKDYIYVYSDIIELLDLINDFNMDIHSIKQENITKFLNEITLEKYRYKFSRILNDKA